MYGVGSDSRRLEVGYRLLVGGLVLAAVAGVAGPIALGQANLSILALYLAVPFVLAPAVVSALRSQRREHGGFGIDWRLPSTLFHFVIAALSVLLVSTDVRPQSFFVGIALAYGLVFIIATAGVTRGPMAGPAVTLYHLVVAFLVTVFSVTLNYPFFFGRTDTIAHISMATSIVETGTVADFPATYEPFVLWHTLTAVGSQLFGDLVPLHTTMFLLSGFVFAAGIVAAYSFGRRVTDSTTAGLLTALLTTLFPLYLFYGMYSIARSITSVLFLLLLCTLVVRSTAPTMALSLVFIAGIVLYHPVTVPFILIILGLLFVIERGVGTTQPLVSPFVLLSTVLITLVYWLYQAEIVIDRIYGALLFSVFSSDEGTTVPSGVEGVPVAEVLNYIPYSFLVFFILVAVLFWFRDERARTTHVASMGVLTLILAPLAFPGPTLLVDTLVGVNVDRFGHYSFLFLGLMSGIGVYELVTRVNLSLFLALLLVVSLFSFGAVSNDFVASDNPAVERPFYTYYFGDAEQQSLDSIDSAYAGTVATDWPACRYISEIGSTSCGVPAADAEGGIFSGDESVLLRENEHQTRPLQFSRYVYAEELTGGELADRQRVYDSGAVSFYV